MVVFHLAFIEAELTIWWHNCLRICLFNDQNQLCYVIRMTVHHDRMPCVVFLNLAHYLSFPRCNILHTCIINTLYGCWLKPWFLPIQLNCPVFLLYLSSVFVLFLCVSSHIRLLKQGHGTRNRLSQGIMIFKKNYTIYFSSCSCNHEQQYHYQQGQFIWVAADRSNMQPDSSVKDTISPWIK